MGSLIDVVWEGVAATESSEMLMVRTLPCFFRLRNLALTSSGSFLMATLVGNNMNLLKSVSLLGCSTLSIRRKQVFVEMVEDGKITRLAFKKLFH